MKAEYEKVLLPKSVQQELEKLRTQAVADAAEVARLQSGFDELRSHIEINYDCEREDDQHSYWSGHNQAYREILEELNRITGVEK